MAKTLSDIQNYEPFEGGDYVAIDFETANEKRSSACAIGLAVVKDKKIVHEYSWLIRPPQMRFNYINISIHGIEPDDVIEAPDFKDLWPVISTYFDEGMVIAHNAGFDMGVLRGCLDTYGLSYPRFDYSCTLSIARNVWPRLRNHKLNSVANHLGVGFSHHDALDDAVAAAKIALHACDQTKSASLEELTKKLRISTRAF
ncbi:MAG TPA: exonuclease [Actinobacteria bacterium]|nr:exonuclease [Actinomycetota bacterium]